MLVGPTSKHVGGITELTLIAPIKQAYVPGTPLPITYAERLRLVFRLLYGIRQRAFESTGDQRVGPLESLRTLHNVQFAVIEDDTKLLLTVSFDGSWEPYIRLIAEKAGPLLDVLFCHCEGYMGHSTDKGFPAFAEWVRDHQTLCDFFYPNEPDLTVTDRGYLQKLERLHQADPETFEAKLSVLSVAELPPPVAAPNADYLAVLNAFFDLGRFFPTNAASSEQFLLRTAVATLGPQPQLTPAESARFKAQLAWLGGVQPPNQLAGAIVQNTTAKYVQPGILKNPEPRPTLGCILLFQIDDGANLKKRLKGLSSGTGSRAVNVAFTFSGLERVVEPRHVLRHLPKEFQEGMQARAGTLGDVGPNHPDNWNLPPRHGAQDGDVIQLSQVDMVVIIQDRAEGDDEWLEKEAASVRERLAPDAKLLSIQPLKRDATGGGNYVREHFGYSDGISQPEPKMNPTPGKRDEVPMGEIICGYPNARGELPPEGVRDLLKDGSFLVLRKLKQDVGAFRRFTNGNDDLVGKLMGRNPDGTPLMPAQNGLNDFDYRQDPSADQCPFRAHIRRANPRVPTDKPTESIPRILRRGFSYGSRYDRAPDDEERGLVFMAYNASIADQFEVIQGWIAGGNSTGILSDHDDVLLGTHRGGDDRRFLSYRHDGSVERFALPDAPLGKLEWGLYLFAPSLRMLDDEFVVEAKVAEAKAEATPEEADAEAKAKAAKKLARVFDWKRRLEGQVWQRAAYEWDVIDESLDGVRDARPYGVLAGDPAIVKEVLSDETRFSVRRYWERMNTSIGPLWLGLDHAPVDATDAGEPLNRDYIAATQQTTYAHEAPDPNAFLYAIDAKTGFERAAALTSLLLAITPPRPNSNRTEVDIQPLAGVVVSLAIAEKVGIPDGLGKALQTALTPFKGTLAAVDINNPQDVDLALAQIRPFVPDRLRQTVDKHLLQMLIGMVQGKGHIEVGDSRPSGGACCPGDFVPVARSVFFPHPENDERDLADKRGKVIQQAALAFVNDYAKSPTPGPGRLVDDLWQKHPGSNARIARQLAGAVQGGVVATVANVMRVLQMWMEDGTLWRLQTTLPAQVGVAPWDEKSALVQSIYGAMMKHPTPDLIHRVAIKDCPLKGEVDARAGETVVVSLGAAARKSGDPGWLFGGKWMGAQGQSPTPVTKHACPGSKWATGMIAGISWAILQKRNLRQEGDVKLSFETK